MMVQHLLTGERKRIRHTEYNRQMYLEGWENVTKPSSPALIRQQKLFILTGQAASVARQLDSVVKLDSAVLSYLDADDRSDIRKARDAILQLSYKARQLMRTIPSSDKKKTNPSPP